MLATGIFGDTTVVALLVVDVFVDEIVADVEVVVVVGTQHISVETPSIAKVI